MEKSQKNLELRRWNQKSKSYRKAKGFRIFCPAAPSSFQWQGALWLEPQQHPPHPELHLLGPGGRWLGQLPAHVDHGEDVGFDGLALYLSWWNPISAFHPVQLTNWSFLKDQLLQPIRGGNESDVAILFHLSPHPPISVKFLKNVKKVADLETDRAAMDGWFVVEGAVVHHIGPDGEGDLPVGEHCTHWQLESSQPRLTLSGPGWEPPGHPCSQAYRPLRFCQLTKPGLSSRFLPLTVLNFTPFSTQIASRLKYYTSEEEEEAVHGWRGRRGRRRREDQF